MVRINKSMLIILMMMMIIVLVLIILMMNFVIIILIIIIIIKYFSKIFTHLAEHTQVISFSNKPYYFLNTFYEYTYHTSNLKHYLYILEYPAHFQVLFEFLGEKTHGGVFFNPFSSSRPFMV